VRKLAGTTIGTSRAATPLDTNIQLGWRKSKTVGLAKNLKISHWVCQKKKLVEPVRNQSKEGCK
jgi:hypothetical protein